MFINNVIFQVHSRYQDFSFGTHLHFVSQDERICWGFSFSFGCPVLCTTTRVIRTAYRNAKQCSRKLQCEVPSVVCCSAFSDIMYKGRTRGDKRGTARGGGNMETSGLPCVLRTAICKVLAPKGTSHNQQSCGTRATDLTPELEDCL